MYLIQLMLPLYDNDKTPFDREYFDSLRDELTRKFGGVTAFLRSPAVGLWKADEGQVSRDDVVIFEIMAEELDREWWARYRGVLELRFRQKEILLRAIEVERL